MWDVFLTVADNLGVSFELLIIIVMILGSLIFFAKDTIIGIIMLMFFNTGIFAWFYQAGLNYHYPLILFFMSLVMLSLSLYLTSKSVNKGAVI